MDAEAAREAQSAQSMKTVLEALGPDLAAAITNAGNQKIVEAISESIAPYTIAKGTSVADAVDTLVRGSSLEGLLNKVIVNQ